MKNQSNMDGDVDSGSSRKNIMANSDLLAVRAYVTARDATNFDAVHHDTIVLDVTHANLQQRHVELRFTKSDSIAVLRQKIHQQTGTPPHHQHLQVYAGSSSSIIGSIGSMPKQCEIPPDTADTYSIGYFVHDHGWTIHVIDINPLSISALGALEDVSLVPKFTLSESAYNAKDSHTLRAWKRQQMQRDPTFTLQRHAQRHQQRVHAQDCYRTGQPLPDGFVFNANTRRVEEVANTETTASGNNNSSNSNNNNDTMYGPESVAHVTIGQRCQLTVGRRRGQIAWTGTMKMPLSQHPQKQAPLNNNSGYWVGVVLDEPVGKNNGTVHGVTYFTAPDKHGAIVRGHQVDVNGDYPVRDILDDESDEDEL